MEIYRGDEEMQTKAAAEERREPREEIERDRRGRETERISFKREDILTIAPHTTKTERHVTTEAKE